MHSLYSYLFLISVSFVSCTSPDDFEVTAFNPFSNFALKCDTLVLPMDLSEAVLEGIALPSKNQCPAGHFKLSFEIINNSDKPRIFYYKVFYQNETYKFDEFISDRKPLTYNYLSGNNFYGSWINAADGFHVTTLIPNDKKVHIITDSFRIVGNPRDEQKYFGSRPINLNLTNELLQNTINGIRNSPDWFKQIKEKSSKNNVSVEEQLHVDAIWIINENLKYGKINNRWKRNPRVGNYSFILVVIPAENLSKIPETIKNISKTKNEQFINPFYDLLYNKDLVKGKQIAVTLSKCVLNTSAKFDPGSGIFIDETKFHNPNSDTTFYSENCGSTYSNFKNAQFEQFFHHINKNFSIYNIPVIYDVVVDNYTQDDYDRNSSEFEAKDIITDYIKITDAPGKTVSSDANAKRIIIMNPGNRPGEFRKENVGISSRIGFTYGRFIAKIQFPAIINKDNVWNGLTCAYWLKFQDENEWNYRSECDGSGYLSKSVDGPESPRLNTTYYSEIDFEILKTSKYWPKTSYANNTAIPKDDPRSNHDIIVTCTNWDLACRKPKNFSVGAKKIFHGEEHYTIHRWDDWYKALTIKSTVNHDSIFNRPYYYEIDWQPDKIIWRIGEEKNNMMEIGYMDYTVTTIPDNQMVMVFSQEFHYADWWPLSPFIQDLIPYPKNVIIGQILEIQVE